MDILNLGQLDENDFELMAKEVQKEIYVQQKDKIQGLIDKKVDAIESMQHWSSQMQFDQKSDFFHTQINDFHFYFNLNSIQQKIKQNWNKKFPFDN